MIFVMETHAEKQARLGFYVHGVVGTSPIIIGLHSESFQISCVAAGSRSRESSQST